MISAKPEILSHVRRVIPHDANGRASGDRRPNMIFRPVLRPRPADFGKRFDRRHHIDKSQIKRCQPEAHDVGCAKVTDHIARPQRLHHGIAMRVDERDMAAAACRVARAGEHKAMVSAQRRHRMHLRLVGW